MAELGFLQETNIAVRYNPADTTDEHGKARHFPSPKGMSGGGVWLGDGEPRSWLQTSQVRLVGIGIEDRPKEQLMIGVRIHCITDLIGHLNPDIRRLAPKRVGFTHTWTSGTESRPRGQR
jgi:hypothetical protein